MLKNQHTITRDNLKALMTSFYVRVIDDEVLAHFFTNELGDDINNKDWLDHINLLALFLSHAHQDRCAENYSWGVAHLIHNI